MSHGAAKTKQATTPLIKTRTVIVNARPPTDTTPPTLTLAGPRTVTLTVGDSYTDDGATCTDTRDGNITPTKKSDNVNTNSPGTYNVTWSCQDQAGNDAPDKTRTVIVNARPPTDTTPPTLTLLGSRMVTLTVGDSYTDDGATCTDTRDGNITPTKKSDNVNTNSPGNL